MKVVVGIHLTARTIEKIILHPVNLVRNQVGSENKNLLSWLMFIFKFFTCCNYVMQVSGSSFFSDVY